MEEGHNGPVLLIPVYICPAPKTYSTPEHTCCSIKGPASDIFIQLHVYRVSIYKKVSFIILCDVVDMTVVWVTGIELARLLRVSRVS